MIAALEQVRAGSSRIAISEVAELLLPLLVSRLSKGAKAELAPESSSHDFSHLVDPLVAWLTDTLPETVLNDPIVDALELLYFCCDLLKGHSRLEIAEILGAKRAGGIRQYRQVPLQLPHMDVPSDAVYHRVRNAVATKAFIKTDGTPFPTASVDTNNVKGQAQLRPLVLDFSGTSPNHEETLAELMWQQCAELSDLDSDIWDYCNWRWLEIAKGPEDYVTITIHEILKMRGILKKSNGKGQRGGYKRSQKVRCIEKYFASPKRLAEAL